MITINHLFPFWNAGIMSRHHEELMVNKLETVGHKHLNPFYVAHVCRYHYTLICKNYGCVLVLISRAQGTSCKRCFSDSERKYQ